MSSRSRTRRPPNVVRCRTAADLLRLVPHLTAAELDDCVALVLFRGTRTCGALRLAAPWDAGSQELRAWASRVLGTACKVDGVDAVIPIAYTRATFAPSGRPPQAPLLRALNRTSERMGLEVRDVLCVAADGWGSLRDPALPRGGRPLADIAPRPGDEPIPAPRTVPDAVLASEAAQDAFADDLERWWTRPDGPGGVLHGVDLRRAGSAFGRAAALRPAMERYRFGDDQADVVALIERMLDPHDDEGDRPCPCRALLYSIAVRQGLENLMLLQFGWGEAFGRELWAAAHAGDAASAPIATLGAALSGGAFRRPDADRIERAIEVVAATERLMPAECRAPLDGVLAWLHWALGGASLAGRLAERALLVEPGRDVPSLVLSMVQQGRLPEWAFREDPASDPFHVPS